MVESIGVASFDQILLLLSAIIACLLVASLIFHAGLNLLYQ
jgi:hypothetical protein